MSVERRRIESAAASLEALKRVMKIDSDVWVRATDLMTDSDLHVMYWDEMNVRWREIVGTPMYVVDQPSQMRRGRRARM